MADRIKVLKNYDGLNYEIVEVIERKVNTSASKDRRGNYKPPVKSCSYKGNREVVFRLPASYGDAAGLCIAIK